MAWPDAAMQLRDFPRVFRWSPLHNAQLLTLLLRNGDGRPRMESTWRLSCDGTSATRSCWRISECEPPLVEHADSDIPIRKEAKAEYAKSATVACDLPTTPDLLAQKSSTVEIKSFTRKEGAYWCSAFAV